MGHRPWTVWVYRAAYPALCGLSSDFGPAGVEDGSGQRLLGRFRPRRFALDNSEAARREFQPPQIFVVPVCKHEATQGRASGHLAEGVEHHPFWPVGLDLLYPLELQGELPPIVSFHENAGDAAPVGETQDTTVVQLGRADVPDKLAFFHRHDAEAEALSGRNGSQQRLR